MTTNQDVLVSLRRLYLASILTALVFMPLKAHAFDALSYIASYPDLISAFGTNTSAAEAHYNSNGRAEGRTASFSASNYLANYSDLRAAFGSDLDAATRHYIQHGFREGRSAGTVILSSPRSDATSTAQSSSQSYYQTIGTTDPNSMVTSAATTYDLRWGTPAATFTIPSTSAVGTLTITRQDFQFASLGSHTSTDVISMSSPLGLTAIQMQETWITDDVKSAWASGWSGRGVQIGVIDDFTANDYSDFDPFPIEPHCDYSSGVAVCIYSATGYIRMTHGEQVSAVAGGAFSNLNGFTSGYGYVNNPQEGLSNEFFSFQQTFNLSVSGGAYYGVAKDASVYRNDFLTHQSATNGLFSEFKRWGEGSDRASETYRSLKVVNLSLGGTSSNPVRNRTTYERELAYANISVVPDAIFVKAAGNSGCVISNTNCDPLNAVLYKSENFKNKTIIVGALNRAGGSIAGYSNRAGDYYDRFLVADGRGIQKADGSYNRGTSFAAPRVSGYAAILRQKFPNLNAEKASSIFLDTATWNPSWGAKSVSTQAVYGAGEANLSKALAPIGSLR